MISYNACLSLLTYFTQYDNLSPFDKNQADATPPRPSGQWWSDPDGARQVLARAVPRDMAYGQAAVPQTQDPSGFLGAPPPPRELHRVMVLENLGLDKPRSLRSFCGT